ncbi:hypothetical protein MRX96_035224 [Rhipicephalus microplus]
MCQKQKTSPGGSAPAEESPPPSPSQQLTPRCSPGEERPSPWRRVASFSAVGHRAGHEDGTSLRNGLINGCVIQESLQPCPSTTAATTTSVVGPQYCYRVSITDAPPLTIPGPGTSGAVTQAVTAKRDPLQFLDSSFVKTPAMTKSFPGAATSTMKLRPKHKTPSLACMKNEETPDDTEQDHLLCSQAPLSPSPSLSSSTQATTSPADVFTRLGGFAGVACAFNHNPASISRSPRIHCRIGITRLKSGRWMMWYSTFLGSEAVSTWLRSSDTTRLMAARSSSSKNTTS